MAFEATELLELNGLLFRETNDVLRFPLVSDLPDALPRAAHRPYRPSAGPGKVAVLHIRMQKYCLR